MPDRAARRRAPPPLAPDAALFLDVDGTLVEIAPAPDRVIVPGSTIALLERLRAALGGGVALVSGRPLRELDDLFAPLRLPAAGVHGLERRGADGQVVSPPVVTRDLDPAREALAEWQREAAGVLIEDKGPAIAIHYRNAPHYGADARRLAHELVARCRPGFQVLEGKMVIEIKHGGAGKGTVVEAFLKESPFAGRRPVFVGDDVTDELGFEAANRLGGSSIRVGGPQPTAAQYRLGSVTALRAWLEASLEETDVPG